MSVILVLVCGLIAFYLIVFRNSRKSQLLRKIPGPRPLPIVGNALTVNVSNDKLIGILQEWQRESGSRFKIRMGPFDNYILLAQAEDIEKVLVSCTDKSSDYNMLMPWLGTGLLTSSGQKWSHHRKLLTPTFHVKILDEFLDVFNEQSTKLVNILGKKIGDEKAFDLVPYITRCALDIICETAMGNKINAQENKDTDYVKAIYRIGEIIQHRQVRPWLHPNFIWRLCSLGREEKNLLKILHGFTEKMIKEKKAEHILKSKVSKEKIQENRNDQTGVFLKEKHRVAFLDLLITAQAEGEEDSSLTLSDVDIREETDTFMFAGYDTTAANVNWTTFLLGCNPECQIKVQEELDEIFGDDKERPITNADMSRMKYLESCIKESLRLYPSVPFLGRAVKSDLQLDEDTIVPAGTTAFLMLFQLHRDPNVFPEPEAFSPDRFLPENSIGRNPFAYIPFLAGPRNCIGQKFAMMEEKIILANIFRSFKVVAAEKREDLILLAELIMRSKNGLRIKLEPRYTQGNKNAQNNF